MLGYSRFNCFIKNAQKAVLPLLCSLYSLYAYNPTHIDGKYSVVCPRSGIYTRYWMRGMEECFGSGADPLSYLIPASMVDNQGYLYLAFEYTFQHQGLNLKFRKANSNGGSYQVSYDPWNEMLPGIYYSERAYPKLVQDNSNYLDEFKNHVHNVFQQSFVQEMEGTNSDYIYFLSYMPPARYCDDYASSLNKPDREGLFIFKMNKLNFQIESKKLYSASEYSSLAYDRTPSPTNNWSFTKFNLPESNYQGFLDGDYIYIIYLAKESSESNALRTYYLKVKANDLSVLESSQSAIGNNNNFPPGGAQLVSRFQKLDSDIYFSFINAGFYYRLGSYRTSQHAFRANIGPALWLVTLADGSCSSTTFHTDFCMIKSDTGVPIWCMFCFNSNARGSYCNSNFNWTSTYMNWDPSNVCLCVSSYPLSTTQTYNDYGGQSNIYPSDTLYSTILLQNCSSWAGTSNGNYISTARESTKSDLYRSYLNTHKIVPYTSPSGKRYFIFAYCYPGKKTHAYIGYCTYSINSSNFVHLNTKVILKSPDSGDNWGDSFSSLTDCSRIISLDVKNGYVWMSWMNADNSKYYYFYIKASDLIPE